MKPMSFSTVFIFYTVLSIVFAKSSKNYHAYLKQFIFQAYCLVILENYCNAHLGFHCTIVRKGTTHITDSSHKAVLNIVVLLLLNFSYSHSRYWQSQIVTLSRRFNHHSSMRPIDV